MMQVLNVILIQYNQNTLWHQTQCPNIKLMYPSKDDYQSTQAARTQGFIARINIHSKRLMTSRMNVKNLLYSRRLLTMMQCNCTTVVSSVVA